jgi:hypothetical protein
LIGGNIDLDHLSLFSQRYARIMRGIERRTSFPRSTMEGRERERESKTSLPRKKKWMGIYTPSHSRFIPQGKIRPYTESCTQKSLAEF